MSWGRARNCRWAVWQVFVGRAMGAALWGWAGAGPGHPGHGCGSAGAEPGAAGASSRGCNWEGWGWQVCWAAPGGGYPGHGSGSAGAEPGAGAVPSRGCGISVEVQFDSTIKVNHLGRRQELQVGGAAVAGGPGRAGLGRLGPLERRAKRGMPPWLSVRRAHHTACTTKLDWLTD